MSDFGLLLLPLGIPGLVPIPDTSEPLAGFFLLQDAKLADHSCETAAGEAATGEAKEEQLVALGVVVDEEVVSGEDVLVDTVADGT